MHTFLFIYFLPVISFLSVLYALARVRRLDKLTKSVGYEQVVDLEGDVSALKTQLRKVNSRISGFHEPKHDSVEEAKQILQNLNNVQPIQNQNIGG